jgi:hypothetical protein
MRDPSHVHEQLISLQRLSLDGRRVDFEQAFLSLGHHDGIFVWSCTLRGVPADELVRLEGELQLHARALDGRTVEGSVAASGSLLSHAETPAVVELAGLGVLRIDGREL